MNKHERYGNGKIYKLVNNVDAEIYIGSTCLPLAKRKAYHKKDAALTPNRFVYSHLNTIGWEHVDIILIEAYPCDTKMELEQRERYYIETLKPSLNKVIPTRTQKEYRQANAERIKEAKHNYYQDNKERYIAKASEYRQKNADIIKAKKNAKVLCQCGIETASANKARHERSQKHIEYLKTLNP